MAGQHFLSEGITVLFHFFTICFFIWGIFFFIKNTTVFFLFSKGAKQTSLQSERSLIFLFPQETCFPSFKKPLLASPCCWASQSCFRGASNGGRGWECLGLVWGSLGCSFPTFRSTSFHKAGRIAEVSLGLCSVGPGSLRHFLSAGAISISPGALLHTCSYCS